MQNFFETTIVSTYIKYLLSCTPLPIYPTINTDDEMIEGVTYIYKNDILKCTKSGKFIGVKGTKYVQDYLYASEDLIMTDADNVLVHFDDATNTWRDDLPDESGKGGLTVTDGFVRRYYKQLGTFDIVGHYTFGNFYPNVTKQFVSNVNYYDSQTHRELGNYLRCLRDIKGLDIMGLYNCFDYQTASNLLLVEDPSQNYISSQTSPKTKLIIVPIKFNRTYTIAIDCAFPVLMKAILYDGKQLIKDANGTLMTSYLNQDLIKFNSLQFNEPQSTSVFCTPAYLVNKDSLSSEDLKKATLLSRQLMDYEKYLYLAIQLPAGNDSSIVVLEGDYTSVSDAYVSSAHALDQLNDKQISKIFRSKLSLLHSNDHTQRPFSDKLIEYLLQYTIDNREYIDENIAKIESTIGYNPPLPNYYPGMWDNGLRYALYKTYMELPDFEWVNKEDIFGFVDLDIENAVNRNVMTLKSPKEKGRIAYGS